MERSCAHRPFPPSEALSSRVFFPRFLKGTSQPGVGLFPAFGLPNAGKEEIGGFFPTSIGRFWVWRIGFCPLARSACFGSPWVEGVPKERMPTGDPRLAVPNAVLPFAKPPEAFFKLGLSPFGRGRISQPGRGQVPPPAGSSGGAKRQQA